MIDDPARNKKQPTAISRAYHLAGEILTSNNNRSRCGTREAMYPYTNFARPFYELRQLNAPDCNTQLHPGGKSSVAAYRSVTSGYTLHVFLPGHLVNSASSSSARPATLSCPPQKRARCSARQRDREHLLHKQDNAVVRAIMAGHSVLKPIAHVGRRRGKMGSRIGSDRRRFSHSIRAGSLRGAGRAAATAAAAARSITEEKA